MSQERDNELAEVRRLHSEADARERDMRKMNERENRHETLVKRLRQEAAVRDDELESLRERFDAAEHELEDLRAIRDALTPPELPDRPGMELAARSCPPPPNRSAVTSTWWLRGRRIRPCWSWVMSSGTVCRRRAVQRSSGRRSLQPHRSLMTPAAS